MYKFIPFIEENIDKIVWNYLSGNPNAIELLEKNPDKIDWYWLSENPNAIHLFEKKMKDIKTTTIYSLFLRICRCDPTYIYDYSCVANFNWSRLSENPMNFIQILF